MHRSSLVLHLLAVVSVAAVAQPGLLPPLKHCSVELDAYYEPGAAALVASERQRVTDLILKLAAGDYCPVGDIIVTGHASEVEIPATEAVVLARARAEYVAELLVKAGAPEHLVHAAGRGVTQPVAPAGDRRNARVEIYINVGCRETQCSFPITRDGIRYWTK
jgi:outer membrane protein OmpA-like peptidoglycan-associated protein